jgi:hypothetical protein
MDDRTRQFACGHWAALDAAMTGTLPRDQVAWCREGLRWSLGDIAAKYAGRLLEATGDDARSVGVESVGHELALALNAAWAASKNDQP